MRYAIITVGFAAVLLLAGLVAFLLAPEGANASTALIVPGVCAAVMLVCALGLRGASGGPKEKTVKAVAVALATIFAVAFIMRGMAASADVKNYRDAVEAYRVVSPPSAEAPAPPAAFFEQRGAPDHDKSYLARTLWLLAGASLGYVGAMLMPRPKNGAADVASS